MLNKIRCCNCACYIEICVVRVWSRLWSRCMAPIADCATVNKTRWRAIRHCLLSVTLQSDALPCRSRMLAFVSFVMSLLSHSYMFAMNFHYIAVILSQTIPSWLKVWSYFALTFGTLNRISCRPILVTVLYWGSAVVQRCRNVRRQLLMTTDLETYSDP